MIQLTTEGVRAIFPKAPQAVVDAFVAKQDVLAKAGILETRNRCAIAFSQVEHECGGYTIRHLTENINYTAERAAQIWPSRFRNADAVRAKYGTEPGWQLKMFDSVYGGRMGNRPGTSDGSAYIGRGGPQITGRDGYREVGKRANLPLETDPKLASRHDLQPEILAAFWTWKNLNPVADVGGLRAVTKPWNGGYIGMADREAKLRGNDPIVARMEVANRVLPAAKKFPGEVAKAPPAAVLAAATKNERVARNVGAAGGVAGGAAEATKTSTGTVVPVPTLFPPVVTYSCIGVGVAVVLAALIMIARKKAAVTENWF